MVGSGVGESDEVWKKGDKFVLVPPDGEYGWAVAFAYFVILGTSVPVQLVFGLLYKDLFMDLGFSSTVISILLNTNVAVGYAFALFNGPLIRRLGYRKVAMFGSTLLTAGMALTSVSVNTLQFMIVYGITASLGSGMTLQASQVAINSYFKEKKSKAIGIAMTGVGACTILMPQLTVTLLNMYGPRGAGLLMAGVVMQGFVGAALLQPVKHHMKKVLDPEQPPQQSQDKTAAKEKHYDAQGDHYIENSMEISNSVRNGDGVESGEATDNANEPLLETSNEASQNFKSAPNKDGTEDTMVILGTFEDSSGEDEKNTEENNTKSSRTSLKRQPTVKTNEATTKKKGTLVTYLMKISTELDLKLLTNVVYANVIVGMSLAFSSESNFSVLTPLIFASMGFGDNTIATLMSTMAVVDIVVRFIVPFILGKDKIEPRTVYFCSMILLIACRSILVLLSTFQSVMILGVGLGIAKGIRNVYVYLVIPSIVPLERLPSAIGLNMALCAVLFICLGPILGLAVEKGGDYISCVHVINGITFIAIVMWIAELAVYRKKPSHPAPKTAS